MLIVGGIIVALSIDYQKYVTQEQERKHREFEEHMNSLQQQFKKDLGR